MGYGSKSNKIINVDVTGEVDTRFNDVNSQLADNTENVKQLTSGSGLDRAMVSLVDDDSKKSGIAKIKPIWNETGIKPTIAVMTGSVGVGDYQSLATLKAQQDEGYEIVSHGVTGTPIKGSMTDEQAITECRESKQWLKDNGFKGYNIHVYSGGMDETNFARQNISRQFYKGSFATGGEINGTPLRQGFITRYDFLGRSLDALKSEVDKAIANNGWIIVYTHSWMAEFDDMKQAEYKELINYIKNASIDIVSLETGLERVGNVLETVDQNGNRYAVSKTGASNFPVQFQGVVNNVNNNLYSAYDRNTITVEYAPTGASAQPESGKSGMIITTKADIEDYCIQLYVSLFDGYIFQRRWNKGTQNWASWSKKTNVEFKTGNGFDKPITVYPIDTIIKNNFPNGTQTATAPEPSRGGVLTTERFGVDDTYSYQTYKAYNGTKIWVRNWSKSSNAWGSWA